LTRSISRLPAEHDTEPIDQKGHDTLGHGVAIIKAVATRLGLQVMLMGDAQACFGDFPCGRRHAEQTPPLVPVDGERQNGRNMVCDHIAAVQLAVK